MAELDGARVVAAMNRQREALAREQRRLPEYTGIPEMIGRAAHLMRKRAEAANTEESRRPYGDVRIDPVPESGWGGMVDNYLGGDVGSYCASWTPAVAFAVADWLEIGANPHACVDLAPMAAVARAYLGEPCPCGESAAGCSVRDECPIAIASNPAGGAS